MTNQLKIEYERLTRLHPDLPSLVHPFINISDVLRAYFILADYFTDASASESRRSWACLYVNAQPLIWS